MSIYEKLEEFGNPFKGHIPEGYENTINQILNEWQLCPKCNGEGKVITGHRSDSGGTHSLSNSCDLCNGKKIISKIDGNPPK